MKDHPTDAQKELRIQVAAQLTSAVVRSAELASPGLIHCFTEGYVAQIALGSTEDNPTPYGGREAIADQPLEARVYLAGGCLAHEHLRRRLASRDVGLEGAIKAMGFNSLAHLGSTLEQTRQELENVKKELMQQRARAARLERGVAGNEFPLGQPCSRCVNGRLGAFGEPCFSCRDAGNWPSYVEGTTTRCGCGGYWLPKSIGGTVVFCDVPATVLRRYDVRCEWCGKQTQILRTNNFPQLPIDRPSKPPSDPPPT